MKRILLLSFTFLTVIAFSAMAQRTVSGKVTDDAGESLPGVNVVIKGTTTGTTTDLDGNYRLSVDEGATLVFSFVGFEVQEVQVGARSTIDISMGGATELQEVVVTALGLEKEERTLGYGIDQVDGEELTKARETNIVNALQGKVTGVQVTNTGGNVGGSSKITIRGVSSLSGRNDPLWVVDGVFINNNQTQTGSRITGNRDFFNGAAVINPDDIESMNVLKGAAATALYGSRAAAGAIVITTKRGKSKAGGGATVTLNSSIRFDKLFRTPDYQQEYAMGSLGKYDSTQVGFDWGPRIIGQEVENLPITGETGPLRAVEDNGINDFFETGRTLINNIAVGDRSDKYDYRLSVTSLNQTGVLPGAELDRYTFNLNAGVNHSDKLSTRFGAQYIYSESQGTGVTGANDPNVIGLASFSSTLDQNLFRPWKDAAGNQINVVSKAADGTALTNNPYWIQNENANQRENDRFIGNFEVKFSPIDDLNLIGRVGFDLEDDKRLIENSKGTAQRVDGNYDSDNILRNILTADAIATYNYDINSDLSLNVLAGFQYVGRQFERQRIQGTSLLIPELFSPANAEQTVAIRDFNESKVMGVYGSAELDYRRWATLTLTARNDWSSTLPLDNNSYFYPSASLAFVFTDAFNIANNVLSRGKLRASIAQVGNDTDPYQLNFNFFPVTVATGQYSLNANFPFNDRLAYRATTQIPPANLVPEQQTSYEFGLETALFDGRINLDVTYFYSKNKNQILALPIPETTGFATRLTNVGQVDQEGLEITLEATPVQSGDFSWNTVVNFSAIESTVVDLAEGLDRTLIASAFNSVQVVAVPGKEFQLFAIPFLRDSVSGRPLIDPATGRRQAGEAKTFGSVLPDWIGGWINSFSYKGITLSATVDVRWGGIMKSSTVEALQTGGLVSETLRNREGTFIDTEGVIDNGDGTVRDNDVPLRNAQDYWTALNDGSVAEPYIYDASFVKLREVSISYRLPSSLLDNLFINSAQIGVEGRNLALLYSKVPHIDPESNLFGSGADGFGIERSSVPSTRSYGFNVRLTF